MKKILQYTMLYFICIFNNMFACPHDKDNLVIVENSENLKSLLENNQGPCMMYLFANGCKYCEKMEPVIHSLANNEKFCNEITFYKVNGPITKADSLLAQNFTITIPGYPIILFLKSGKLQDTQIGYTTQNVINKKLEKLLNSTNSIQTRTKK